MNKADKPIDPVFDSRPDIFFEYNECVEVFWINPWSKEKERLFMMMWPRHPIEKTAVVEQWYQEYAALLCNADQSKNVIAELREEILEHQRFYEGANHVMQMRKIEIDKLQAELAKRDEIGEPNLDLRTWYKDRDFPEIKVSNSDIVAIIENENHLKRVIDEHNALVIELSSTRHKQEYDRLQVELAAAKEQLSWNLQNNDEFGCEFVGITILRQELIAANERIEKLRDAIFNLKETCNANLGAWYDVKNVSKLKALAAADKARMGEK